jgi:PKHD-type hydroxylase
MLLHVPGVLTAEQVASARQLLDHAAWIDGKAAAAAQSARAGRHLQLPEDSPQARQVGELILAALQRNALFMSAALPLKVFPPIFNHYAGGHSGGSRVDNAIRQVPGTPHRIRTDLSATLFFADPDAYEGGELVVEDTYGAHSVKLPAGDMVLYPSTSLHHVRPVTSGARIASFFWIQSLVRDDWRRTMLFDMDTAIQRLARDVPDHPSAEQLTGVYHNLLRQWSEV